MRESLTAYAVGLLRKVEKRGLRRQVKRIWNRLLNYFFIGFCTVLISACGSEAKLQDLDALKMAGVPEGAMSVVKEDVYAGTYVDKQGTAVFTITESSFEYIAVGEIFEFPQK